MTGISAIAPITTYGGDIKKGKAYKVINKFYREDGVEVFSIRDDSGEILNCLWEGCAHIGFRNWKCQLED